jgi:hypothetical protein
MEGLPIRPSATQSVVIVDLVALWLGPILVCFPEAEICDWLAYLDGKFELHQDHGRSDVNPQ